nr:MAG TPA: hypothetical protein [Caudoviricetes sp.]
MVLAFLSKSDSLSFVLYLKSSDKLISYSIN